MKSVSFCAAVAVAIAFNAFVSNPALQAQSNGTCVLDVATVFKNHSTFNQQLAALQNEAEQFKTYLQNQVGELRSKAEKLKTLEVNSAEYGQLESQIAQANAALEVERGAKTREFIQREAKLHFETYVLTTNAVSTICNQKGIRLVLQFSSLPMELSNPESIMQRVNSDIVYFTPGKDITNDVIGLLNQSQGQPRTGSVPTTNR